MVAHLQVKQLQERLDAAYTQCNSLESDLKAKSKRCTQLGDELSGIKGSLHGKQGEAADLQWRCDAAEEAVQTLRQQAPNLTFHYARQRSRACILNLES